jgi:hypothetical protein
MSRNEEFLIKSSLTSLDRIASRNVVIQFGEL